MKTLYLLIAFPGIVLGFFSIHTAEAHLVPLFSMQFDQNHAYPITYWHTTKDEYPSIVIPKSSEFSIPLIIKNYGSANGSSIYFHTTFGNNFSSEIMPTGISVQVTPDHIVFNESQDQKVNVVVKVNRNAIAGEYMQNIVARWTDTKVTQSVIGAITFRVENSSQNILPPLKQTSSGIPAGDVTCDDSHVRVIKKEDHMRACVKPDTVPELVLRDWAENPLDELLLRYTNQSQSNLLFYKVLNEPKIREWSVTGWRYNSYSFADDAAHQKLSATVYLYLSPSLVYPAATCKNGSTGLVVLNLRPLQILNNYTEAGCNPDENPSLVLGTNLR
ncbi:MAG: hypothetical protein ACREBB_04945 [Nitrosotalea sp.]